MNLAHWVGTVEHRRRMTMPIELDDAQGPRASRIGLVGGTLVVAVALLWASLVPIRELAVAWGQVLPEGQIRVLQHLEGGVVDQILVRPGAAVRSGQPILRLAPEAAGADLGQLQTQIFELSTRRARLLALLRGEAFTETDTERRDIFAAERGVYDARLAKAEADRKLHASRVLQQSAELSAVEQQLRGLREVLRVEEEQLAMRASLLPKKLIAKREVLQAEAAVEQARIAVSNAEGRLAVLGSAVAEAQNALASAEAETRRIWAEELATVEGELATASAAITKLQDRTERLVIRAPSDGDLLDLIPTSPGDVVRPGEVIGRVVPTDTPLIAAVDIRPEDIGHVRLGDGAEVQVTTFDPTIYGKLNGRLTWISDSTFQAEDGSFFYRATLMLDSTVLGDEAHRKPLKAGMVLQANIVTGEKSLLRYLLRPIYKNLGLAFSER